MQQVKAREDFQTLRKVMDHRAWGDVPPTLVNAFYELSLNTISNISSFTKASKQFLSL
jgi:predicted metalloendopeptidase